MSQHRSYTPQEAADIVEQADSLLADGHTMAEICRRLKVSELTYLRWKMRQTSPVHPARIQALQAENQQLRAIVAQQALDLFAHRGCATEQRRGARRSDNATMHIVSG